MKKKALLFALAFGSSMQAEVATIEFSGIIDTISENQNPAFASVDVGDSISGYFEYDPSLPLANATYEFSRMSITIGGNTITVDQHIYIRGRNNYNHYRHGTVDYFSCAFDSSGPTAELDPLYVYALETEFFDTSASIFSGNSDPELPIDLNLADYDLNTWEFRGSDIASRTKDFNFSGTITRVAPSGAGIDQDWYADAFSLADGWRHFNWFKSFKPVGENWIYHGHHGWMYVTGDDPQGLFLWDAATGRWFFTSEFVYPWMYAFGPGGGWVFFFEDGSPGSRFFARAGNGRIVTEEEISIQP